MFTKSWIGNQHPEHSTSRPPRFQKVPTAAEFFRSRSFWSLNPFHEKSENPIRPFFQTHVIKNPLKVEKVDDENSFRIVEKKPGTNDLKVSATTKALDQMQTVVKRRKSVKSGKASSRIRRQKLNKKLMKLLTPKNAVNVLHEIKPNCTYTLKELPIQGNTCFVGFVVEVKDGEEVLGTGQGPTKCSAKNSAAENSIKTLFSRSMSTISKKGQGDEKDEEHWSVFPWAGLAQLAIYKMFNEWQLQGPDYQATDIQKLMNLVRTPKITHNFPQGRKEIPENAHNLHPTTLLFQIHPHMNFVELERSIGPPSRVKVAFEFDGQQFCGISTNKKEAKKEAAKLLLSTVYGVKYES